MCLKCRARKRAKANSLLNASEGSSQHPPTPLVRLRSSADVPQNWAREGVRFVQHAMRRRSRAGQRATAYDGAAGTETRTFKSGNKVTAAVGGGDEADSDEAVGSVGFLKARQFFFEVIDGGVGGGGEVEGGGEAVGGGDEAVMTDWGSRLFVRACGLSRGRDGIGAMGVGVAAATEAWKQRKLELEGPAKGLSASGGLARSATYADDNLPTCLALTSCFKRTTC
ncbi:hypothetical protein C8R45DRAFT_940557 [Mycena sanguinolenta]|nr:hypothetical protein C8R45DRAFT_940557 [Mycena sanguinolenta]